MCAHGTATSSHIPIGSALIHARWMQLAAGSTLCKKCTTVSFSWPGSGSALAIGFVCLRVWCALHWGQLGLRYQTLRQIPTEAGFATWWRFGRRCIAARCDPEAMGREDRLSCGLRLCGGGCTDILCTAMCARVPARCHPFVVVFGEAIEYKSVFSRLHGGAHHSLATGMPMCKGSFE